MKKILSALTVILSVSLLSINDSKVSAMDNAAPDRRQCCSKLYLGPDGSILEITACAGWLFSNNAKALSRACDKVDEADEVL